MKEAYISPMVARCLRFAGFREDEIPTIDKQTAARLLAKCHNVESAHPGKVFRAEDPGLKGFSLLPLGGKIYLAPKASNKNPVPSGGFGRVKTVFDSETGACVALKIIASEVNLFAERVSKPEDNTIPDLYDDVGDEVITLQTFQQFIAKNHRDTKTPKAGRLTVTSKKDKNTAATHKHYIAMQHAPGQNLYDSFLYDDDIEISTSDMVRMIIEICKATLNIHQHGLVHLDLKEENLIWDPLTKSIRVVDFGSTLEVYANSPRIYGTMGRISPEHIKGDDASPSDDLYSLGTLFKTMLAADRTEAYELPENTRFYPAVHHANCPELLSDYQNQNIEAMLNRLTGHPNHKPNLEEVIEFFRGIDTADNLHYRATQANVSDGELMDIVNKCKLSRHFTEPEKITALQTVRYIYKRAVQDGNDTLKKACINSLPGDPLACKLLYQKLFVIDNITLRVEQLDGHDIATKNKQRALMQVIRLIEDAYDSMAIQEILRDAQKDEHFLGAAIHMRQPHVMQWDHNSGMRAIPNTSLKALAQIEGALNAHTDDELDAFMQPSYKVKH